MPDTFEPDFTERQSEAYLALNRPGTLIPGGNGERSPVDVMYGGAKGGGKTFFLCAVLFLWIKALIAYFDLRQTDKPLHLGFLGRKQAADFTLTTLQTWQEIIPASEYIIRGATDLHPRHILINKTAAIDFGGLDRQETISKFNSAEYVIIGLDQAEETTQDDVATLRATRRMKIKGHPVQYKGIFTANPAQCWLKQEFILHPDENHRFIQALPSDNPHLPASYIQTLKLAFKHRPQLLEAYLHGNWDLLEGAEQVLKESWIRGAFLRVADYAPIIKEYVVLDTARFGDDECVFSFMRNLDIVEKTVLPSSSAPEIVNVAETMSSRHDNCQIVVETTESDVGAAVVDFLGEHGRDVLSFNPAAKADAPKQYYSKRCEAWHNASKVLSSGILDAESNSAVCITEHGEGENYGMDETMIGQLCSPRYKWRAGKLVVEPKAETKKRLGRSPDHADVYVIAIWAWPYINAVTEEKRRFRPRKPVETALG